MYKYSVSSEELQKAVEAINYMITHHVCDSQTEIANAIEVSQSTLSKWLKDKVGMKRKYYDRIMKLKENKSIKMTVNDTISAGHDIIAAHNATVNSEGAEMMWKDYQSRMINAVLKSDLPFDIQNKVISIIVNA